MLRALWSLLFVLIGSSLVLTATVHARETPGSMTIECSGTVHSDGDSDQSQGDSDGAIPHHHGTCHGSTLDMPMTRGLAMLVGSNGLHPNSEPDNITASHLVEPALRPPSA